MRGNKIGIIANYQYLSDKDVKELRFFYVGESEVFQEIYPDIGDYEEEVDEIKEELIDYFQQLKGFYKKILKVDGNVTLSIFRYNR